MPPAVMHPSSKCSTPDGIDDRDGGDNWWDEALEPYLCSTPDGIDDRDGPSESLTTLP